MTQHPKYLRTLAIAPSTRGFGYAVVEGHDTLADWGVKTVEGDKNSESLARVERLIALYEPEIVVLQDTSTKTSRRAPRIKTLSKRILNLVGKRKIKVALFSHEQVRKVFFEDGKGTKHELAKIVAERFPEELGGKLPPKRKPWMTEDPRMDIFDAVALALVPRLKARTQKKPAN